MARPAKRTTAAVAETASLDEATAAAGVKPHDPAAQPATAGAAPGPGTTDPLIGDLRRGGLLPLLVLHFVAQAPTYGNQLMERIAQITGGTVVVNPNTMYPLLRSLEARGLVSGEWEHPDRRSRRFYRLTERGEAERRRLEEQLGPRLDAIARGIERIRAEIRGD